MVALILSHLWNSNDTVSHTNVQQKWNLLINRDEIHEEDSEEKSDDFLERLTEGRVLEEFRDDGDRGDVDEATCRGSDDFLVGSDNGTIFHNESLMLG